MSIAWGEFQDMAIHYLRELANREVPTPLLFCKEVERVYGVCTYKEFAEMQRLSEVGMYRPVSAASPDEFIGLMFSRFSDFFKEEVNADKEKDLPARK